MALWTKFFEVKYPNSVTSKIKMPPTVAADAPEFVQTVTAEIMAGRGDALAVSKMPCDGKFPTATTQYEKRNNRFAYSRMAAGGVYSVRHVLVCVPACHDPYQGV